MFLGTVLDGRKIKFFCSDKHLTIDKTRLNTKTIEFIRKQIKEGILSGNIDQFEDNEPLTFNLDNYTF
ncbi:MAG TPA: hypothetical protein DEG71_10435 [Clostridiales bacterium]|nr:hypothetical protein [Clostridiales bacterium]